MFRSLFRTATPLLKTVAKKAGKRLLSTGLDTGVQIAQDVMNGQPLKKAAKTRAKAAGKKFFTDAFLDMTQQQGRGKKLYKRKRNAASASTRQVKKPRTSAATFKTIFD